MSTSPTIDDIASAQREALSALTRGEQPAEETLDLARQGMAALAGDAGNGLSAGEQAVIGDYLLGRQSPGQAEGAWRLLLSSPDAAEWAERVRDALAKADLGEPPPLPSDDGAPSPAERARRSRPDDDNDEKKTLRERREERDRRRTAENAQEAAEEMASPFRTEAREAQQRADDRIELPRWAPRPAQLAMYAVLVVLIAGLGFSILVHIPVNTNAVVLISQLPAGSPGSGEGGLQIIALFPQASGQSKDTGSGADVHVGDTLRVALPGEVDRSPMRLRWVSDGPQAPRKIIDGYGLPLGQANRVVAPSYVALASLKTPPGKSAKSYEGTTTTEASVQTGSRRIISLLF